MWRSTTARQKTGFSSLPRFFFILLAVAMAGCKQIDYYAAPLIIPQNHTDVTNSTQTTGSANFTLVNGSTIWLNTFVPSRINAISAFSFQTTGGVSATAEVALMIDNETGDGLQRFLSGTNDKGIGAALHSKYVTPGKHNVSVVWRRASGAGTLQMLDAQVTAVALP